ncbi:MAG: hypothetical protein CVT68_06220 [Actinobacteria bacterium HGW-Actinobacteria-8]|nr:MAG: hypothetical protein CVT68_06220 [Actinobacteria bacterium HGW-Actinobacteria-8]
MNSAWKVIAGAAGVALLATSCSSGSDEPGVARLEGTDATVAIAGTDFGSAEDQALAFAQCMRDNGVEFPDPTVDADGSPSFEGAFGRGQEGGFDPQDTSFQEAMTACDDLMEGLSVGPGNRDFDSDAMNEALYAYTQCLRDEGLDVGDITLGGGFGGGQDPGGALAGDAGGATPAPLPNDGDQPGSPADGVQGGGFDSTDRFATPLGQDPEDPAWIAANQTCQPALTEAMTSVGVPGAAG